MLAEITPTYYNYFDSDSDSDPEGLTLNFNNKFQLDYKNDNFSFVTPYTPHREEDTKAPKKRTRPYDISPARARLLANQLIQFEQESDFQEFMVRFHCLPYATEFKFEVNAHINDHYALKAERAAAAAAVAAAADATEKKIAAKPTVSKGTNDKRLFTIAEVDEST